MRITGKTYSIEGNDALAVLKWLRQNGERFTDWDFSGTPRNAQFWFNNSRLETAYIMMWEFTK